MMISDTKIFEYNLPLLKPIKVGNEVFDIRQGIIIHLKTKNGNEGIGEIAPLPGRSPESFEEAKNQICSFKSFLANEEIPDNIAQLDGTIEKWLGEIKLYSSVRFGVEMAALNTFTHKSNKPLYSILSSNSHSMLSINGLIQGERDDVVEQAKALVNKGYHGLKLKVGGNPIEVDIEKVKAVNKVIEGKAVLHCDVNQKWDINQALTFAHEVGLTAVDYIEEPFSEISQIPSFFMETSIPVALDESLMHTPFEEIKHIEGVDLVVLKPMIIGGIEKTWQILKEAKRLAIRVVISSSFESSLGILTLANLAGCTNRDHPAGLDTLKCFKNDLLKIPIDTENGKINLNHPMPTISDVDPEFIREIANG